MRLAAATAFGIFSQILGWSAVGLISKIPRQIFEVIQKYSRPDVIVKISKIYYL